MVTSREVVQLGIQTVAGGAPLVLFGEQGIFAGELVGGRDDALDEGDEGGGAGGFGLGVRSPELDGPEIGMRANVPPAPGEIRDALGGDERVDVAFEVFPGAKARWQP